MTRLKSNHLLCMSLVMLPLITQAGTPCEDTPDPAVTATFSNEVLNAKAIEIAITLQRGWPVYYDCALNLSQKVQVCDALLEQNGITRDQFTTLDTALASQVKNAMPSLRGELYGDSRYNVNSTRQLKQERDSCKIQTLPRTLTTIRIKRWTY